MFFTILFKRGNKVMKTISIEKTAEMIIASCDSIVASKDLLTEVDSKIGDGDHGIGMSGGMAKAKDELLAKAPFEDINTVFKTAGMAMLNSMGGASGVIFGSLFLGGIKKLEKITELDGETFSLMMRKALDTVKMRGKAEVGDKTMVDALEPAVLAMEALEDKSDLRKVLEAASSAAEKGVEDSKKYIAKFGKAQYLGERAVGFQDAGATSISIIFKSMFEYL